MVIWIKILWKFVTFNFTNQHKLCKTAQQNLLVLSVFVNLSSKMIQTNEFFQAELIQFEIPTGSTKSQKIRIVHCATELD